MADENKKKILIVEDERAMAHALQMKLQHAGFEAEHAADGEEAISLVEKGGFDMILLDLVMPKMNGFEVLESLKEKNIDTPVLVLSNLSQEGDEDRARELGAKDFLIKSNTPLKDIIEKIQHSF